MQRKIISYGNASIEEAVNDILCKNFPESIGIADLGCSSGPNTLMLISEVIEIVSSKSHKTGNSPPEIRVALNDLPGNDFNNIFMSLPAFYQKQEEEKGKGLRNNCFVSCVAGSFYGRLFPKKSLHLVHSSSSLHWLSQVIKLHPNYVNTKKKIQQYSHVIVVPQKFQTARKFYNIEKYQ